MSEAALSYWQQRLGVVEESLSLPVDNSRIDSLPLAGKEPVNLPAASVLKELENLSAAHNLPLFTLHLAIFHTLLFHYTGQKNLCVVVPASQLSENDQARTQSPELVPVVAEINPRDSFIGFARELNSRCSEDLQHAAGYSLKQIADSLNDAGSDNQALFRAVFSFDTSSSTSVAPRHPEFQSEAPERSAVEIQLELDTQQTGTLGQLRYRADLFATDTMSRFANHFLRLLESVVAQPDAQIGEQDLLTEVERSQLIESVNQTQMDYPESKTLSQLFSEKVLSHPDSIAVRGPDDRVLSYQQLEQHSNQLAGYLASRGVGAGCRVGVYLERRVEMLSTLLGVIKSGAAYVPLDPLFPADRLSYMAQDAELALIVTQQSLVEQVPIQGCEQLVLETLVEDLRAQSPDNVDLSTANSAAYVIYTSGSTGKPKGVQVGHRALTNFLWTMRETPGMSAEDNMLAVTTLSFDIAGLELYLPLLAGGQVTLASREEAMDPQKLISRLASCKATVMQATPATWKMLIESGWQDAGKLRIWCGGEAMPRDLAESLVARSEEVWNLYGPTETTIWSSVWRVQSGKGVVPVGVPIGNTQLYVLDESAKLVLPGVSGELYIGGDGVADGYLNRDQLTAERFVADNFSGLEGRRLYRTGDRARWRSDGQLEVQGRLDDQVKLRGYRIEPGEIRAALVESESVRDAVVMVREDESLGAQLVAYLLPEPDQNMDPDQLRSGLQGRMPEYMVPSAWVTLEEFPLTPNGKVDKKQLPAPQAAQQPSAEEEEVFSENEALVASIWKDVLGADNIGRDKNFFELGGNSLLAIKLAAKIRKKCGVNIPIITLFHGATIVDIAQLLGDDEAESDASTSTSASTSPDQKTAQASTAEGTEDKSDATAQAVAAASNVTEHKRPERLQSSPDGKRASGQHASATQDRSNLKLAGSATCRLISGSTGDRPFFMLGSNPRYALATTDLDPQIAVYQLDAYALQVSARNDKKSVPNTVEKIAAAFLHEVKAVQPRGPYRIGGGCEGALIALELALLLQQEGEQVEQLLSWHTPPPGPEMKRDFGGSTLRRFWWQFQSILAQGKSSKLGLDGYLELLRHEIIEYSLLSAMFKYRPGRKFNGPIDLVVLEPGDKEVTGVDDEIYRDHIDGWRSTVTGNATVALLKGTHDTWLINHVDVFREFLASKLNIEPSEKIA